MRLGRLFWKFFFAFWLALLLAGAGVGAAMWLHHQGEIERLRLERDPALAGGPRAATLVSAAAAVLSHGGVQSLRGLLADLPQERGGPLLVIDTEGRDLLGRPVAPETVLAARAGADSGDPWQSVRRVTSPDGVSYLLFLPASGESPRRFGARGGPGLPFERRGPPGPDPLVPVVIGLIASIVFSLLLAWHLSKPIRHLRWALGAVASGKLETRVRPLMAGRRDEISDLGQDFDRMAQHLQSLIGAQRRLLHDVSHELRSPLARLQAAIGLVRQDPARLEASLDRIEREAVRLDELVGQLLTIARLDAGVRDAREECIDLVDLAAAIADDARFEAQAQGRELSFEGVGDAALVVRGELIQRAFENVIRNGVKYTGEGSTVEAWAGAEAGRFVLRVADRGPGVPEADLEAIFEPFYRGLNGQATSGFGLGLAIAKRAVVAHGGHILAANRVGGGLVVEIRLPLAADSLRKG
ncbi:HAMP domain-containing protein [Zoogloea oleivorans]|uniref:histidine kinase n=1 Tax=Zoogloea oleivorans TaxID=1552750 RepID=A0A6C2CSR0_9RHOO|nr:HAMP domain-containing protein [Zoogloea oleivorans]